MRKALTPKDYKEFYEECWMKYSEDEVVESSKTGKLRIEETTKLFLNYVKDENKLILDIGTGAGIIALKIYNNTKKLKLIGLDIAEASIAKLFNKVNKEEIKNRVNGVVGDASNLPFVSNSIDAILACEVLEHVLEPEKTAAEVIRVLKIGGLAFISTPNSLSVQFRNPLTVVKYFLYKIGIYDRRDDFRCVVTKDSMVKAGLIPTLYRHGCYSPKRLVELFTNIGHCSVIEQGNIGIPYHKLQMANWIHRKFFDAAGIWSYIVISKIE